MTSTSHENIIINNVFDSINSTCICSEFTLQKPPSRLKEFNAVKQNNVFIWVADVT